ncbi:DUF4282 domain-containing protein [Pontibacillus salicampi]|uniref:DUF4282 domain-containing protein n=1 Tax=Pontibacillus salicampi TaxID=1449801 RepID=A0ABV6LQ81_9BACI
MQDYLHFDKMITPTIIKAIFWIGVGLSILTGFIMVISGATSDWGGGLQILTGLVTIILGPFIIRIYCELLIVLFKMNEALQELRTTHNN